MLDQALADLIAALPSATLWFLPQPPRGAAADTVWPLTQLARRRLKVYLTLTAQPSQPGSYVCCITGQTICRESSAMLTVSLPTWTRLPLPLPNLLLAASTRSAFPWW